ncbi:MAG TPA: hypothetical protein VK999_06580, partial [Methylotenera sp.]|nr:hypothetical protein [Methylotenera sp.]
MKIFQEASSRIALTLTVGLTALASFILARLLLTSFTRPLWVDEAMAMANYPLSHFGGIFEPLPFYDQAAPPLFNLIMHLLGQFQLQPFVLRAVLFSLCSLAFLYAGRRVLPATIPLTQRLPILIITVLALPNAVHFGGELKFYGLEMAGAVLILAWPLSRTEETRFEWRDLVLLVAFATFGIATIVLVAVVIFTETLFLLARRRIELGEICRLFLLAGFLGFYYLIIRHATAIQLENYSGWYTSGGLIALQKMSLSARIVLGPLFALLVVPIIFTLYDLRNAVSRRLAAVFFISAIVFLVL